MNSRERKLIEHSITRAKNALSEELAKKKEFRRLYAIEEQQKRIYILKQWLTTDDAGNVVKPTEPRMVKSPSLDRQVLRETKRKEFEDMLVKIDSDAESGATMVLKTTWDVDAVFDLIQREVKRGRQNMVFVWPKPIVSYYKKRVSDEMKRMSTTDAGRDFKKMINDTKSES